MTKPVTKKDLDEMRCGNGCTHDHSTLYFHSRCHPKSGTYVRYEKHHAQLIIECAQCEREVLRIKLEG